jgi:Tfp pilus assembly protein PilO
VRRLPADRLWILAGAVAIAVVLAVGWFFMVSPQYDQVGTLNGQAATSGDQVSLLQRRLAQLRKQNENLPAYLAELAKQRAALPTTSGLSDLLRELQTAGDATGAAVSGVNVGGVTDVSAGGNRLYALPLTLTVTGSVPQLRAFLDQLQQVQPRAVLVTSASLSSADTGGASAAPKASTAPASISLGMKAFVAPGPTDVVSVPTGTPTAAPAPSASRVSAGASPRASA